MTPQDSAPSPSPGAQNADAAALACARPSLRKRLREEMRSLFTPGPRMADEWICVASVMLAILLAHAIGAEMVAWAAFTAFVLLKSEPAETIVRGVLRITGTICGAALAIVLAPLAASSIPLAMLVAAVFGTLGLYGMLTARRAYAWLLFGLTFEMILLDKLMRPDIDTWWLARTRLLEVCAGTLACATVSITAATLSRRKWLAGRASPPARMSWNPTAARHALQAGVALASLPLIHAFIGVPELPQAAVTIMAVMIVPVSGLSQGGFVPVTRRLVQRALGCLAGGAMALCVLLVAQGNTAVLIAGTCLGIVIGRHIENGKHHVNYIGLQFTLAVLVVLVPDSYASAQIEPGLLRLISIFVGMAVLEPVLLVWHFFGNRRIVDERQPGDSGSE